MKKEQMEEIFHCAMCNGLAEMSYYGLELTYNEEEYQVARKQLKKGDNIVCYEDVLLQMLRNGNSLTMHDFEQEEYNVTISLSDIHERMERVPKKVLMEYIEERDDAFSADTVLQVCFFNEIIFG